VAPAARYARTGIYELFTVADRVVVAYTLNLHRRDGSEERMAVMAIWTVADGRVTALREVDARPADEPSARGEPSGRDDACRGACVRRLRCRSWRETRERDRT
jgi:hypothetical protein